MNWQSISGMKEDQGFISLKKFHSVSLGFYQTQCISEVIIGPSNKTLLLILSVCVCLHYQNELLEKTTRLLSILSGLFLFLFMH